MQPTTTYPETPMLQVLKDLKNKKKLIPHITLENPLDQEVMQCIGKSQIVDQDSMVELAEELIKEGKIDVGRRLIWLYAYIKDLNAWKEGRVSYFLEATPEQKREALNASIMANPKLAKLGEEKIRAAYGDDYGSKILERALQLKRAIGPFDAIEELLTEIQESVQR